MSIHSATVPELPQGGEVPHELADYLNLPNPAFSYKEMPADGASLRISLTSQLWHGVTWTHEIVVEDANPEARRAAPATGDTAILYITGDGSNPTDLAEATRLSEISGLPIAMLFEIPVQPIDGRFEDDLIAWTFERYLETGDATWPLLFPMAKSAITAIDALQAATKGRWKRFIVMGASKRGWTTWMAAASGDKRIIGIAPTVFDNLNIPAQMAHQHELWGHFSPMIADYTKRNLQAELATPSGIRLATIIDPYRYLSRIKGKILIAGGSNDPYWAADALSLYKQALPYHTSLLTLPNQGHVFHDKEPYLRTVGAFGWMCAAGGKWPHLSGSVRGRQLRVKSTLPPELVKLYVAQSPNLEFQNATWNLIAANSPTNKGHRSGARSLNFAIPAGDGQNQAIYSVADYALAQPGGAVRHFSLSTPMTILRKLSPPVR